MDALHGWQLPPRPPRDEFSTQRPILPQLDCALSHSEFADAVLRLAISA